MVDLSIVMLVYQRVAYDKHHHGLFFATNSCG